MVATFGVGQVFFSLIWFFLFVIWIMLVFRVSGDLFRSDMSGFTKVLWLLFMIALPYIGVFTYLLVRGGEMAKNEMAAATAQEQAVRDYIRSAAGGAPSVADELERLAALRDRGVIDQAEFDRLKAKALG